MKTESGSDGIATINSHDDQEVSEEEHKEVHRKNTFTKRMCEDHDTCHEKICF